MSTPIEMTWHASQRLQERGAAFDEVEQAVRTGKWQPASHGKWHAAADFPYNAVSPVNGQFYRWKTVDAVFVEELDRIVVVTVKVYYYNS